MNTVARTILAFESTRQAPQVLPRELAELFLEDLTARACFARLSQRDRDAYVTYVLDARLPAIRERRAALVTMSLVALASKQREDA